MHRKAFTLVELLVYVAVFSIVVVGFITVFVSILRIQSQQSGQTQVEEESQFLLQQIQYYVENARLVDMTLDTATSTLQLREFSSSIDPTTISATGGVAYLNQGTSSNPFALTSSHVAVSNMQFTRHYNIGSSSAFGADSVSFSFTISYNVSNTLEQYTQSYQSSAVVSTPVPKIALIQKTTNAATPTSTTIAATYQSTNEGGGFATRGCRKCRHDFCFARGHCFEYVE